MPTDFASLQHRIGASANPREALKQAADDICAHFRADRVTVYQADREANTLSALVQKGLEKFGELKLPIDATCIAGYVAHRGHILNIADVRDAAELASLDPPAKWIAKVDERTGYRSREMLVAPVVDPDVGRVIGVVQLINHLPGGRFPREAEEDLRELCKSIAEAMSTPQAQLLEARARLRVAERELREWQRKLERAREEARKCEKVVVAAAQHAAQRQELRAKAEGALHEGAPAEAAEARELLFQRIRECERAGAVSLEHWARWRPSDVEDLEWVCALAESGHVGARRLRSRLLHLETPARARRYPSPAPLDPASPQAAALHEAAGRVPLIALALALVESTRAETDLAALIRWLRLAGERYAALAEEIAAAFTGSERIGEEAEVVRRHLDIARNMERPGRSFAEDLAGFREAARRSREMRAAQAAEAEWRKGYAAAADKAEYLRAWLKDPEAGKLVLASRSAMIVAAAFETGLITGKPDLETALQYYGMMWSGQRGAPASMAELDPEWCALIGANLEIFAENKVLARAWYERGVERRDPACLTRWVRACAARELGLDAPPSAVLETVRAFIASGGRIDLDKGNPTSRSNSILDADSAQEKIAARAENELARGRTAEAMAWLEVGALCGASRLRRKLETPTP